MLTALGPGGRARRLRTGTASMGAAVLVAGTALLAFVLPPSAAAGLCATPGGSGAGGSLTGVVNTYYPGTAPAAAGATSISVGAPTGAATPIAAGDLLLVIQMQAADINSTNTNSYGHGGPAATPASGFTALNASGMYEYVRATGAVSGGAVPVSGLGVGAGLLNSYVAAAATVTSGVRTFQVVRVPQYTTATTSSTLTAGAWNGSTGGVLALDTTSTLTLNGTVSVDGLGFRGGIGIQRGGGAGASTDVVNSSAAGNGGTKAEGIAGTPSQVTTSNGYPGGDVDRGAPGNAGGGGTDGHPSANDENSGGGGGGNGGAGGVGGNTWSSNLATGGYGGVALTAGAGRVFLGGGGGAGTGNNFTAPNSNGAAGGGIVLVRAASVGGAGSITANGAAAYNLTANDGGGGGGAGGTIMVTTTSGSLTGATLTANGGRGGDAWATQAGATSAHGPGGGGGGGWILTSSAPSATSAVAGANGITTTGNLVYGSAPGAAGQTATISTGAIPGVSGGAECADVSLTKSATATVNANGTITYSLTASNAGPAAATGLSVLDTLPPGVTFVSASGTGWTCVNSGNVSVTCTRASIASGGSAPVITITVTAPLQGGAITNNASVTATTPDPNPANNSASASTTVTALADLAIAKTGPPTVLAAGSVAYSLAVTNAGPSDAANLIVTDTLPAGVTFVSASGTGWSCSNTGNVSVTCTRPALATGTAAPSIAITVTAPAQGAALTNQSNVTSSTTDPVPGNNFSNAATTVTPVADLAITKSGPVSVVAGAPVSYTLTATNNGPSDAANLTVTDVLPAGVTFVSASGAGWTCSNTGNTSVSCTLASLATATAAPPITVVVTAPGQATSLTNSASVASTTFDPVPGNNTATVPTTVTASANLALSKSGPASVVAGSAVSYALAVSNLGPSDAANLTVTDVLPAGVTFVSASGAGWACSNSGNVSVACTRLVLATGTAAPSITVVVTAPAQATTLTNNAFVSSTTADPNLANNTGTATTTVTASADLSITKSGPPTVLASGSVSYTLVVSNLGPSDATNLTVTDLLPSGVTFVSASGAGWTCTNTGNTSVSCTLPVLAAAATAPTITLVVTAPAQSASLTNSASVASTTADPNLLNNSSSVTTGVTASADLSIAKSGPASVVAGSNVTYQLTVANNGPSDAANLTVTDTLPPGVTFVSASGTGWTCTNSGNTSVSCTRPALTTGTSAPVITVVVTAPAQPTSLTNNASVATTTFDPVAGNNSAAAITTVTASADLAIAKSGPATVVAGAGISYALVVTNNGPSDAANLTVTDALPAGVTFVSASGTGWACNVSGATVTCTRLSLAAGATAPTVTVVVTAPAQAASLTNTASVASTTPDPTPGNNISSATTSVTATADLAIAKSGPASVVAGSGVSYTLSVTNNGPSDAANLTVTDTLPAGVTFVSASGTGWICTNSGSVTVSCTRLALAAGAAAPGITVVVTAPAQATSLSNSASVGSTTADPVPGNNSDSALTTVTASADLAVVKSGPPTVTASGSVTYALVVTNNGPSDAASLTVTDTLPTGVAFASASGTGWTCTNSGNVSVACTRPALATGTTAPTISVTVTAPAQSASLTNKADVIAATPDPVPGNNSSSVTTSVAASADLSIAKSGPPTIGATGSLAYTLVVANAGPSDAAGVTVTDLLPAGVTFVSASGGGWTCTNSGNVSVSCAQPLLAAGATASTITVVVTAPAQPTSLTNSASVTSGTPDPDPSNNSDSVTTGVSAVADLSLVKSGPATVVAGGSVTYTLDVTNNGPSDAANVTVTDALPAGVTFASASGAGWTCSHSGNASVSCTSPTLAAASSAPSITVVVTAPAQATSLTNSASVASTTADPDATNNSDSVITAVTASADLAIAKSGPASVIAAGVVGYTLVVTNAGPSDAAALTVTDSLPPGVTFVSVTGTGWTCTPSGNVTVTCTRPALATGAAAPPITVTVTAPSQATSLTNSASVTSSTADPDGSNNSDTAITLVTASADLSLTKSGPPTVSATGSVTYSLVVANAGPSDATALTVTDVLPAGVTFVSASGTGWTCTAAGNVSVDCTLPSLPTGATAPTITVVVTAPPQAVSLSNTASVASTTSDPDLTNNTDSATTGVSAVADLAIAKSGPATVVAAGAVSYDLVVTNAGPSDAVGLSVSDSLPAGVTFVSVAGTGWTCSHAGNVSVACTTPTLATGVTAPAITVVVTAPVQATSLTNTASVASTTADPDVTDNSDSVTTAVTASADVAIVKSGPAAVPANGTVTYDLVVSNAGPSDAATITVTDALPGGVTFVSANGAGWACSNVASTSVTCTTASLATGATAPTITVVVTAPGSAANLTNTADVASTTADPDLTNNTSSVDTQVAGSADLTLVKTGPATVQAGGLMTYTLLVANAGPDDAVAVQLTDTLPGGVVFQAASGPGWTCTSSGNVSVTCDLPVLPNGASSTVQLVVAAPLTTGALVNNAHVTAATADPTPANNASAAQSVVTPRTPGGGGGNNGGGGGSDNGGGGSSGGHPQTGADVVGELTWALLLLLAGAVLVTAPRRRTR